MNSWEELKQECLQCHACSLAETRTNVVFGVGTPQAEVVIVGEAPGANEDKQGEPFVGRAGKLLDDILAMSGLDHSRLHHQQRYSAVLAEPRPLNHGERRPAAVICAAR